MVTIRPRAALVRIVTTWYEYRYRYELCPVLHPVMPIALYEPCSVIYRTSSPPDVLLCPHNATSHFVDCTYSAQCSVYWVPSIDVCRVCMLLCKMLSKLSRVVTRSLPRRALCLSFQQSVPLSIMWKGSPRLFSTCPAMVEVISLAHHMTQR